MVTVRTIIHPNAVPHPPANEVGRNGRGADEILGFDIGQGSKIRKVAGRRRDVVVLHGSVAPVVDFHTDHHAVPQVVTGEIEVGRVIEENTNRRQ